MNPTTSDVLHEVEVFSEKAGHAIVFEIEDENLAEENYECIGMSNSDYGS